MKVLTRQFNIYLALATLLGLFCGCQTPQEKQTAALRVHIETSSDPAGTSQTVSVIRSEPVLVTIAREEVAGLPMGMLKLKWPNDIVVEAAGSGAATAGSGAFGAGMRKVAGVLGETEGVGTADQVAIVGIGINADWRRDQFPAELADSMTSLREVSGGRPIDTSELLDAFLLRLEPRVLALRDGHFDVAGWHDRQVTTGRMVRLERSGGEAEEVRAVGVDGVTGALLVENPAAPGVEREVLAGEVVHVRLAAERAEAEPRPPASPRPGVTP